MGIEDEINDRLAENSDRQALRDTDPDLAEAVDEIKELCLDVAKLLLKRGVPTEAFEVLGRQPASMLHSFFKSPAENPRVKAADGWRLSSKWGVDVFGQLWEWRHNLVDPEKPIANGDFAPPMWFGPARIEFRHWRSTKPRLSTGSVIVGGLFLHPDDDGRLRLYIFHPAHDPSKGRYEMFREHLLAGAAEQIKRFG